MENMSNMDKGREFMKCPDFGEKMPDSDQAKKLPQPPLFKEVKGAVMELSADFESAILCGSYAELLDIRRSERNFAEEKIMTQDQLAFLLWGSQGVQTVRGRGYASFRPVPSGGARHPFETYIAVRNVDGLAPGLYRYLPQEHIGEKRVSIEILGEIHNHSSNVVKMLAGQQWAANAQVVLFLSCTAYRAEWRYADMAHRVVLIDQGHVGQNWMLSASAMGMGSCCIAAYDQKTCDKVLGLDGVEEYTVYACAVGAVS